jgi:hypothetical protein
VVAAGDTVRASDIPTRVVALMRQTVAQAIPTATYTSVTFDVDDVDDESAHSTSVNTSRYTAVSAGWYWVAATGSLVADAAATRGVRLAVNGTAVQAGFATALGSTAFNSAVCVARLVQLSAGDYLEVQVIHNKGSNLNTSVTNEASQLSIWLANA